MPLALFLLAPTVADDNTNAAAGIFGAFAVLWILLAIGLIVLSLVINWKIAEKAGFPGVASLLMLIPLVNLIVLCYFAFTEWPVTRELRMARSTITSPQR